MNVTELKEKLLTSLDLWADARISDMVKENPALAIPSVYMKRASHNIIAKHKDSWGKSIFFVILNEVSVFFAIFASKDRNFIFNRL